MKTYIYVNKNSSATIILSAYNDEEAEELLTELVVWASEWRLDDVTDLDEED